MNQLKRQYRQIALAAVTALVLTAPAATVAQDAPAAEWGPLSVVAAGIAGDDALGPGWISIGADCVTFRERGSDERVALVWPADATAWRSSEGRIVFEHPIEGSTRLSDGDRVMLGGQALAEDPAEVAARTAWVQPPDPSCPSEAWLVDEVRIPSSEGIKATSDLKAIAKAHDWTIEQAKLQQKANRAVDRVSSAIHDQRPDIWIGAALSETPGGAPSLYVKGPAPQLVRDLVAEADYLIALVDEQPYSRDELEARSTRVHEALVGADYPSVSTGFDLGGAGVIESSVLQVGDLPAEPEEILAFVPEELRADVDLQVTIAPPRPSVEPEAWGPLAVIYQPAGFGPGMGLDTVTLHIDDACVWAEHVPSGNRMTLVWEGNHVAWRPATERVVFTDSDGRTVRLGDGDRIKGGGVALPFTGGRGEPDPSDSGVDTGDGSGVQLDEAWLKEPHPSCPDALFFLSEVTAVRRAGGA